MKLKFTLNQEVVSQIEEEIIYALPFDLDAKGESLAGFLVVTKEKLHLFKEGKCEKTYLLEDLVNYEVVQFIGSGCLKVTRDEEAEVLCIFTPKWFKRFAELSKMLNYYALKKVHSPYDEKKDEYICEKCGYPLLNGSSHCFRCQKKSTVLLKMLGLCRPYKKLLIGSILITLCVEILWIINPYILRLVIDGYIVPRNQDTVGLMQLIMLYLTVFITISILENFTMRLTNRLSNEVAKELRGLVFEKIQALSLKDVSNRTVGELMNRMGSDTEKIQDFIAEYGRDVIIRGFSLIVLGIILFATDYRLALLVFLPLPPVLWIVAKLQNTIELKYWKQWRKHEQSSSMLHDILSGIRVVKAYGNEKIEIERYTEAADKVSEAMVSAETFWSKTFPFLGYLITIGEFFVLWFAGNLILKQEMQIGELIQYTTYVSMIYVPLRWSIQLPRVLADAMVSGGKVFELLEEESELVEEDEAIDHEIVGDVTIDHISFGYKTYEPVLKDVTAQIKAGEMIGIVGASGEGKSTLINLIMRLYDVTEGSIQIDGIDLRKFTQKSLRSQIGVVLQETFLFGGSILDNIAYSKPDATFEEIISAAKIANAHEFIAKLPDAYHTLIGERGYTLSGGERQRIAIARAILHNPKILILDEATSALDTETEKKIQEALDRVIKGKTTFAIAHRLSTLKKADRLLVIDKGTIKEMGTHQELMDNQSVYYNLVMAQRQTAQIKQ